MTSSRERLALAEGRYQACAGSFIMELGDTQGGVVSTEAQDVAAAYTAWRSRERS